jgi:endonuclease YncB( thermonuclease family)
MTTRTGRVAVWSVILGLAVALQGAASSSDETPKPIVYENVNLDPTQDCDGDSIRAMLADGRLMTIRIYGADCPEIHLDTELLVKRFLEQQGYFGIAEADVLRQFGLDARSLTLKLLEIPFSLRVIDALEGEGRHRAIVITHDKVDLAWKLVTEGLARADGISPGFELDYGTKLSKTEEDARMRRAGIWAISDATMRQAFLDARAEEERKIAAIIRILGIAPVQINRATIMGLRTLPHVTPAIAGEIIRLRHEKPFTDAADVEKRVKGIGPENIKDIAPFLDFAPP